MANRKSKGYTAPVSGRNSNNCSLSGTMRSKEKFYFNQQRVGNYEEQMVRDQRNVDNFEADVFVENLPL